MSAISSWEPPSSLQSCGFLVSGFWQNAEQLSDGSFQANQDWVERMSHPTEQGVQRSVKPPGVVMDMNAEVYDSSMLWVTPEHSSVDLDDQENKFKIRGLIFNPRSGLLCHVNVPVLSLAWFKLHSKENHKEKIKASRCGYQAWKKKAKKAVQQAAWLQHQEVGGNVSDESLPPATPRSKKSRKHKPQQQMHQSHAHSLSLESPQP
uniref:Uncharacterized protein n=1 Tax=Moniliophthora roreri TaxID=221103 RepID=A0A0W0GE18_MONRR